MVRLADPPAVLVPLSLLLVTVVVGGIAWVLVGEGSRRELDRRGEALVAVLESALLEADAKTRLVEERETARMLAVARRIDALAASVEERMEPVLARVAEEERVGRLFLVDPEGRRLASVAYPPPLPPLDVPGLDGPGFEVPAPADPERLGWDHAFATMRPLLGSPGATHVEGLRENVFGTHRRLGVALGLKDGGVVLVRAEAEALDRLHETFGVEAVAQRLSTVPDVARVEISSGGRLVAASGGEAASADETATYGADVALDGDRTASIRLSLSRERVVRSIARQRVSILVGSLLAASGTILGLVLLRKRRLAYERAERERAVTEQEDRRLAEMGALAGLMAHELANPLNTVALKVPQLRKAEEPEERSSLLASVEEQLARVRASFEGLLGFARSTADVSRDRLYGVAELRTTLQVLEEEFPAATLRLDVSHGAAALRVRASSRSFDEALRNVIRNACQATDGRGAVDVRWTTGHAGALEVVVDDAGSGFPEDLLEGRPRLGDSRRRGGHGLGLPLTRRFVQGFGGKLRLESAPSGGGRVRIVVPKGALTEVDDA